MAHPVPFIDYVGLGETDRRQLETLIQSERTLAAVLTRRGAGAVTEIVTQDEFTHDVVIPLDARRWLVYDTT
jgi:hypothetical protein